MANNNNNNNNNNNATVNTNKEIPMDPIQAAIDAQKELRKNKDWKLSEIAKVKKARNTELKTIDEACDKMIKDVNDPIQIAQIKLAFEAKKLEVRAAYEPQIKQLEVALEEITQGAGEVAGEKIGAVVAPVTKAVGGFWGSLKERATK